MKTLKQSSKDNAKNITGSGGKKQFKKEVLDVFKKFGYLDGNKDYEVTFRTTSGNIAWININSIETIK